MGGFKGGLVGTLVGAKIYIPPFLFFLKNNNPFYFF